ncbi:MAG TPA: exosortase/archaeosortase family protein [Acidimicrobiales bacterium]|nr:exosortase/archaeosortase family protein [Acidimicrobiales bacterium]
MMVTEVVTTIAAQPRELQSGAVKLRDRARLLWVDAQPKTRTAVQMGALLAVVFIAYSYSLTTLLQLGDLNTPLAYVSLVPLIALILAAVNSRPKPAEPSIHDRQTDYIIGVPLMTAALWVNLFLPNKLSAMFWVWRIDLLSLPFFVAGAVAVIFGVRVLWRQKIAVAFLFLAWPYPYTSVLLGVLNAFTTATLFAVNKVLRVVHVATPIGSADNAVFTVVHHGHPFNLSVISACSGVNSVVGFLLVGVAFAAVIRGPLMLKVTWLVAGMLLLWVFNLGRLILVFWAGRQYGEHFAIGVLHPFIGLLLFALGVGIMLLCMRPLGLRIEGIDRRSLAAAVAAAPVPQDAGGRSRKHMPVPRIYVAVLLVLVFGIIIGFGDDGLQSYNLVADVSGSPKVISYIDQPVTPLGWTSHYEATFGWAAPLFGEGSIWNRYELYPSVGSDLPARVPLVADVIDSPDLSTFEAFGVEQCYQFHGYSLTGVSQVSLTGGITGQAMSYTSQQYGSWSIVYWILPVKSGSSTVYERVVLYVQNMHGLIAQTTGVTQAAMQSGSGNSQQFVETQNRNFLVAFAREMITAQADTSAPVLAKQASA